MALWRFQKQIADRCEEIDNLTSSYASRRNTYASRRNTNVSRRNTIVLSDMNEHVAPIAARGVFFPTEDEIDFDNPTFSSWTRESLV